VKQLNPYLQFKGNCREAMEFYKSCLGGELNIMVMGDSPMAAQVPPGMKNQIMHSSLMAPSMTILASDSMQPQGVTDGNMISLCINGDARSEIEPYFNKLATGGKVLHALEEMFFGTYGDITDKFGIHWMFQANPPPQK
jgi:PhnB protein